MAERKKVLSDIRENIINLDSIGVQEAVKSALSYGISPREIMTTGVSKGLETIGNIPLRLAVHYRSRPAR